MPCRTASIPKARNAWFACALCLLMFAPRPAAALDLCVQTLGDLLSGLQQAQTPQSDGTVTLRLVAQTYAYGGAIERILVNRLNLLGGYSAGCTTRTVNAPNTVIEGGSTMNLDLTYAGLGATIEGVSFRNLNLLRLLGSGTCLDYGKTISFRRNIVANPNPGGFGRFWIDSDCGPTVIENNLVRARLGLLMHAFPDVAVQARLNNNTFWGSNGPGLELFRGSASATFDVQLNNNIFWNNAETDIVQRFDSAPLVVHARNNTWTTNAIPLASSTGTLTANPQLDANLRPIEPSSPSINSGYSTPPGGLPGVDLDGGPRIVGTAVDRGAYESTVDNSTELVVTNTSDSGIGSLRQAIINANLSPDFNLIRFATGSSLAVFVPATPYPDIVASVRIDGYSLAGTQRNTNPFGNNAVHGVAIVRSSPITHAFRVPAGAGSGVALELDGLVLGGFTNAVVLQGGRGHVVRGSHFGPGVNSFLSPQPNINSIIIGGSADQVTIGGTDDGDRNTISGSSNGTTGGGYAIATSGSGSLHRITNNFIGTTRSGNAAEPNVVGIRLISNDSVVDDNLVSANTVAIDVRGDNNLVFANRIGVKSFVVCLPPCTPDYALPNRFGIVVTNGASDNVINGNHIAYNDADGLRLEPGTRRNRLAANLVFANQGNQIDLIAPTGPNPINYDGPSLDGCTQANCDQNFPTLTLALGTRYSGRVSGNLSTWNGNHRIEFFAGSTCSGGYGEAQTYLGATQVTVSGGTTFPPMNGSASFEVALASPTSLYGKRISVTATDPNGNTSELSVCTPYICDVIFRHGFEGAAEICPSID